MMEWELRRRICRGFLTPSSRHGRPSAQELDCSSQSNLSKGTGGGLTLRAIVNRTGTTQPSASFCHFIQRTNDLAGRSVHTFKDQEREVGLSEAIQASSELRVDRSISRLVLTGHCTQRAGEIKKESPTQIVNLGTSFQGHRRDSSGR